MEKIRLIEPNIEYKEELLDYKKEFIENNEVMHGGANLTQAEDIDEWIASILSSKSEETVKEGLVPASILVLVREEDNKILGITNIRYRLNDFLLKVGGHIGYSVRKSERKKGYGNEILRLSLEECKELNIDRVLVTCDEENIASARVIENNNGILENVLEYEGEKVKRYWIDL